MPVNLLSRLGQFLIVLLLIPVAIWLVSLLKIADSTRVPIPIIDTHVNVPSVFVVLIALCVAYAVLDGLVGTFLVALVGAIPVIGPALEERFDAHRARRAEGLPSGLSRRQVSRGFDDAARFCDDYIRRLEERQSIDDGDSQVIEKSSFLRADKSDDVGERHCQ